MYNLNHLMAKPEPCNGAFTWFWGQNNLNGPLKPSKGAFRWFNHLVPQNHMVQRVLMYCMHSILMKVIPTVNIYGCSCIEISLVQLDMVLK
jgi:hypothetical protein